MTGSVVIIGGTAALGRELAAHYAGLGRDLVVTSRDAGRADKVAEEIGGFTRGIALDLTRPETIAGALSSVGPVDRLALVAIDRDENTVTGYDHGRGMQLVMLKLVGYTEVVHVLSDRLTPDAAVLIFGGMARLRPYPGSTTVTTINAGVIGLVRTLSVELAPRRVNSIHPGQVGDSPYWMDKPAAVMDALAAATLTGRLATMADVTGASVFLLENPAVNGVDLGVDGGYK